MQVHGNARVHEAEHASPQSGFASCLNSMQGLLPLLAALLVVMVSVILARYWRAASELRMQQEQGRDTILKDMAAALEVAARNMYELQQVLLVHSETITPIAPGSTSRFSGALEGERSLSASGLGELQEVQSLIESLMASAR